LKESDLNSIKNKITKIKAYNNEKIVKIFQTNKVIKIYIKNTSDDEIISQKYNDFRNKEELLDYRYNIWYRNFKLRKTKRSKRIKTIEKREIEKKQKYIYFKNEIEKIIFKNIYEKK